MDRLQQLYANAPVWAQNAMCSVEGARIRAQRFPPGFGAVLDEVESRMQWSPQQRAISRLTRLRAMLVHAGRHVPYWRELFATSGFRPERITDVRELGALPLLTKDVVLAEGDRMRAEQVPDSAGRRITRATSGTTGAGLVFDLSEVALRNQWAVCWRFRRWHGLRWGTWCAQLGGRTVVPAMQREPPFFRVNYPGRQLLLSGYHLSPHSVASYLDEIERRRIPWIHGYPSLVALIADAARERRWSFVRWVTLASESATAAQRDAIEAALGVRPVEHYAQSEAVANASELPGGVLRLDDDYSHVELVEERGVAGSPALRRIVGTSLDNWHMPFIRYDTGDLAAVPSVEAPDDRAPGRVLLGIDGRREDYVELSDGTLIGRTDHIFKELTFIREAQIRQARAGEIAIHLVPRTRWTEDHDARLRAEVARRLGTDVSVRIALEERLPRGPTGKLRLVVREEMR